MIRNILTRICYPLLALLWMVGVGHAEIDHAVSSFSPESAIRAGCVQQSDAHPWIGQLQRHLGSHGKVHESLVEHTAQSLQSLPTGTLSGKTVHQGLVISQCAHVYSNQIGPLKLRRLIFPFHTFW